MRQLCFYVAFFAMLALAPAAQHTEEELIAYIKGEYEKKASQMCTKSVQASWNYETDLTDVNSAKVTAAALESAKFSKDTFNTWFKDAGDIKDVDTKRMLDVDLQFQGRAALNDEDLEKITNAISKMTETYSSAKICPFDDQGECDPTKKLSLDPDIEKVLADYEDYDEMQYVWKQWHDVSGKLMREDYKTYVTLNNKVAKANDYADAGEMWRDSFETENFMQQIDDIWEQVAPLYKALHNYTSVKLQEHHGKKLVVGKDGLLPAHVFGNMWAQSWSNLDKILKPFKDEDDVDITKALIAKKYTAKKMFEKSDEFYKSMGLLPNAVSYGPGSMITKPDGKEVTCHASAWDFCNRETFLIKMCTKVNQEDFITVHHEMGHIQYYLQYKDQPIVFRDGANPGFHEAVGDTIALSVQSIPHLIAIELLDKNYNNTNEASINSLMSMALDKIAFLPFGLLIDKWRWNVFSGATKETAWNADWWKLREQYQLIKSPVARSEDDFDPGAKFHVAADSQYISYFVSHILQFQFYRSLCIAANKYNPETKATPLHECDFFNSKEAGDLLAKGLSLGKSKPWPEVLKIITGTDKLDACALLEYFSPLGKHFGLDLEGCPVSAPGSGSHFLPSVFFIGISIVIHYLY